MIQLFDVSLSKEKFSDLNALLKQQRASLGYISYLKKNFEVDVIRIGHSNKEYQSSFAVHFIKSSIISLLNIKRIASLIHSKKAEQKIILFHGFSFPFQLILLKMFVGNDCKIFIQHHAEQPFNNFLMLGLQKMAYKHCTGYFFSAHSLADKFVQKNIINETKIYEVMEGSTSFTLQDKEKCRRELDLKGKPIFLWVGRLNENKDPFTVIAGFSEFVKDNENARLYMIFHTEELHNEVEKMINDKLLTGKIILIGKVEHEQLQVWYNATDFFVSGSHYESGGYALCEALACGCIPVVTSIASFKMMTGNGCIGKLFTAGSSEELLEKMNQLKNYNVATERYNIRRYFDEHLSFEIIANKFAMRFAATI